MKLYLLTTSGLGDFYLVGKSPNHAESKLKTLLDKADYGFRENRKIESIRLLSEEVGEFPAGVPNFSSGNRLVLETTCA